MWSSRDKKALEERGINSENAGRQLRQLREGVAPTRLEGACVPGDGIHQLTEQEVAGYVETFDQKKADRSIARFVPASGAATRMFKHLFTPDTTEPLYLEFQNRISDFAFFSALEAELTRKKGSFGNPNWDQILALLLSPDGLGYGLAPKGIIPFHRYESEIRNAFEEHLSEASDYAICRHGVEVHFTVGDTFHKEHRNAVYEAAQRFGEQSGDKISVSFSNQHPATDTIAVGPSGEPVRDIHDALIFRPGGHGALLRNLSDVEADVVYVKNIDNVLPAYRRKDATRYKKALGGLLVELVEERKRLLRSEDPEATKAFILRWFLPSGAKASEINDFRAFLNRPIRVCGMVRNEGEPGGGPFWLKDQWGRTSAQIVEKAQIDTKDDEQAAILQQSTHFNPVDLVCHMRGADDEVLNLRNYVNYERVIMTEKSHEGTPIRVLEHPGLWNGSMEGWLTLFVEVPLETFAPVKTVNDLLRDAHQPLK